MADDLLWPRYADPGDLSAIEAVPLEARGLPESTYALLVRAAERWPERTALTVLSDAARWDQPRSRTFAELLAQVHRYANLLHRLGIRRGDAVALMAPNCEELIAATLAAQVAGIAAPLNGALSVPRLGELLRRSGARILITAGPELSPDAWTKAREVGQEVDAVLLLRPTGTIERGPLSPVEDVAIGYLADLAEAEDADAFAGCAPAREDLAAFIHTGGTTGTPKLAAHTHANQVANAWMMAASTLFDAEQVVFAALPLFHVNALMVTLLTPLFHGQRTVWAAPLGYRDPALYPAFWKIVQRYRIAMMSAVPTVYAALAQYPVDADISSLRHAVVGASPLPAATRAAFRERTGLDLVEGYGLTEATCASARSFPHAPRPGAVGQRMPYQRVRVLRPDTREQCQIGERGVLAIAGPTVFAGYVTDRTDDARVLDAADAVVDGWLDTGDLAHLDADGFIHLAGRAKDLIIRGGHNIDPSAIEEALLAHPAVTAAGAVGRPDPHSGEVPVAYVAVDHAAEVDEKELVVWAAEYVPEPAAAPKSVTILEVLPLTEVGKPDKLPLRADATRRALAEALCSLGNGFTIDAVIEGGTVAAHITAPPGIDRQAMELILNRYSVPWRFTR
ncbi:acyl-CoA synthetase [Actinospica sp. MGRD01-02]|uniref:Acyl-CoA synthetase n=1 Tax=Actinospica acidithermotolerans TaxID=2828514 RepID=A0A941EFX2_9ACTN|nr:acyl-CoA synthetase [Actinospica acidithermotolerans]MBR7830687.1 acyl-CoA synthetase [Actinospica acidithermotolerans]